MSIEEKIEKLVTAIDNLTSSLSGLNNIGTASQGGKEAKVEDTNKAATTNFDDIPFDPAEEYELKDLRRGLAELVNEKGEAKAIEILGKFNAKKLSDVDEKDYPKFMAVVNKETK